MTVSIRDRIRGHVDDTKYEPLVIPEWGITAEDGLRLRSLTAAQRGQVMAALPTNGSQDSTQAECLAIRNCVIDKDGKQVFGNEDIPWLKERNPGVLDGLFLRIKTLSRIGETAVKEAGDDLKNGLTSSGGSDSLLSGDAA